MQSLFLALALLTQAPLPTPTAIAKNALRRADPYTLDLMTHAGAIPSAEHAARNRAALQNVINAVDPLLMPLRAGYGEPKVRITVPNRGFFIDGPVWLDQHRIALVGAGPNASIRLAPGYEDPVLILGVPRVAQGRVPSVEDFPVNPLDPARWSVVTGNDHHLGGMASPFAFGVNRWATGQAFTWDFVIDTRTTPLTSGPLFGAQEGSFPAPVCFRTEASGMITMTFSLAEKTGTSVFQFAFPTAPQVTPVRVQLNLATRAAAAWVSGTTATEVEETWRTSATLGTDVFQQHQHAPFLVGAAGTLTLSHGSTPGGMDAGHEITLCALHVSNTLRGTPPAGGVVNWFTVDANTIALLPFDVAPASCAYWRTIPVQAGGQLGGLEAMPRRSSLILFDPFHAGPDSSIGDYEITDLQLGPYDSSEARGSRHGSTVALGHCLFLWIERCTLEGGAHGLGCLGSAAAYTLKGRKITASGHDAAIHAWYCDMDIQDLTVPFSGRNGFLHNHFGEVTIDKLFVGPHGQPETMARTDGGGYTTIRRASIDIEGGPWPSVGGFWSEASTTQNIGPGGLDLDDVILGSVPVGVPLIKLADEAPEDAGTPTVTVRRFIHQSGDRVRIDADDAPRWLSRDLDDPNVPGP